LIDSASAAFGLCKLLLCARIKRVGRHRRAVVAVASNRELACAEVEQKCSISLAHEAQ
jgi:hypothetical protein